jgi:acetylornithine/succinyldiaminopimelate/putrescine aminotransferase
MLRKYIKLAKSYDILVCADEIMCGVGRHGQNNSLFLSTAWDLDVDAIAFGKAIAAGVYPLSGVAFRTGRCEMRRTDVKPFQSHTYAHGGHTLALLAAKQVLSTVSSFFNHASNLGEHVVGPLLKRIEHNTQGTIRCFGQGLLWGGVFLPKHNIEGQRLAFNTQFCRCCHRHQVLSYVVPKCGFLITPPIDVPKDILEQSLLQLEMALYETLQELAEM